jgi:hypothetical protein
MALASMASVHRFEQKSPKTVNVKQNVETLFCLDLRSRLSRKTEGMDPMMSWQPVLAASVLGLAF